MGAVRTTQRQKRFAPYRRYAQWKCGVRLRANVAGIPPTLKKSNVAGVGIEASWERVQRIDADNVIKAVLDSLWAQDRRVLDIRYHAVENTGGEEAVVTVMV